MNFLNDDISFGHVELPNISLFGQNVSVSSFHRLACLYHTPNTSRF